MNRQDRKIIVRGLNIAFFALAALVVGTLAYGDLQDYNGLQGRDYHATMHEKGRCTRCHTSNDPTGYPEDDVCLKCHELEELVQATVRESEEDRWQNPHDNLHYGQDVPCVECHGEHTSKAVLCANCHNFDYPNHEE